MMNNTLLPDTAQASACLAKLCDAMSSVIKGKAEFIKNMVICLAAGGHVLIEDYPGLGKTTAAKALAALVSDAEDKPGIFKRIQFTPDLLPYDITGVDVFDASKNCFVFSPGPVFTNILLADEINRTTPKVQSALLEVMAENQVTVGNKTYSLGPFFFTAATQNPAESEGVYPLPSSQLDRFMMKLSVGYPDFDAEMQILLTEPGEKVLPDLKPVCSINELLALRTLSAEVYADEKLAGAVIRMAEASRQHEGVEIGVSPRAVLHLFRAAKMTAVMNRRNYLTEEDILNLAEPVLAHRIKLKNRSFKAEEIIKGLAVDSISKLHKLQ